MPKALRTFPFLEHVDWQSRTEPDLLAQDPDAAKLAHALLHLDLADTSTACVHGHEALDTVSPTSSRPPVSIEQHEDCLNPRIGSHCVRQAAAATLHQQQQLQGQSVLSGTELGLAEDRDGTGADPVRLQQGQPCQLRSELRLSNQAAPGSYHCQGHQAWQPEQVGACITEPPQRQVSGPERSFSQPASELVAPQPVQPIINFLLQPQAQSVQSGEDRHACPVGYIALSN